MFIVEGWRSIQDFINSDYKLVSGAQTPYASTTKNAGDVVVRTTTGYQSTNKTNYISAWPGNGERMSTFSRSPACLSKKSSATDSDSISKL